MEYGTRVLELLRTALERDERAIAIGGNRVEPKTVGVYTEHWLQYLLFREALGDPDFPTISVEGDRVDIRLKDGETVLAEFELKGPFQWRKRRPDTWKFREIVVDFAKQGRAAASGVSGTEHYVLLVITGDMAGIQPWLETSLLPALSVALPDTTLIKVQSDPIPLNADRGSLVMIAVRLVHSSLPSVIAKS